MLLYTMVLFPEVPFDRMEYIHDEEKVNVTMAELQELKGKYDKVLLFLDQGSIFDKAKKLRKRYYLWN